MKSLLDQLTGLRLWPLMVKELLQIGRNRRLVISLVIPPTLMMVIFGFALNPKVSGLRLGVVDMSRSAESRELISAFGESRAFEVKGYYESSERLGAELSKGNLDIGLVIPWDFARKRARRQTAEVQILLDAVNTNNAEIAGGYAGLIIRSLNERIAASSPPVAINPAVAPWSSAIGGSPAQVAPSSSSMGGSPDQLAPSPFAMGQSPGHLTPSPSISANASRQSPEGTGVPVAIGMTEQKVGHGNIVTRIALLFNPGLVNSWFIVTGTMGILLVNNGSVVSAATMIKEKEIGTIEQLLMTPATATEITIAKIGPLFFLLVCEILLVLLTGYLVFGVPVRGSLFLLIFSGSLCVLAGIGIGITLATFTRSQQQAQLMAFFINPPISMLSGATYPVEGMPEWLRPVTLLNPVRHFSIIARGVMLKGVGVDVLYPNLLALLGISLLLIAISSWRFRKQLG
jgi:ABC-2 type transport system permease protein